MSENNFKIAKTGEWSGIESANYHVHDSGLAAALVDFFKARNANSVLDLGAGTGAYTAKLNQNNISTSCYDGNPDTQFLSKGKCGVINLTNKVNFFSHDWVLSLEIGEHLPKKYEQIFLRNLAYNNKNGIVLSWAIPGQGGDGHVNEQSNDYVRDAMFNMGYKSNLEVENSLRDAASVWWFKNTIMVFEPIEPQNSEYLLKNKKFSDHNYDMVYVINRKSDVQRLESVSKNLDQAKVPYNIFEAINGYEVKIKNLNTGEQFTGKDLKTIARNTQDVLEITCDPENNSPTTFILKVKPLLPQDLLSAGEIGLWCSNILIWKDIVKNGYQHSVIFEDDIHIKSVDYNAHLENFITYLPSTYEFGLFINKNGSNQ